MRTILAIMATAIVTLSISGCKENRTNDYIITKKTVAKAPMKPQAMQRYTQKKEIEWGESHLTCEIEREPNDSLPMVKDETGRRHKDNSIKLSIKRSDGSTFFEKTFTKATFDAFIDDDYRKTGILEGLVFDKTDGDKLIFAASVSHPQTDEYIPLVVKISRTGVMDISRDTQLDTNGEEEDER